MNLLVCGGLFWIDVPRAISGAVAVALQRDVGLGCVLQIRLTPIVIVILISKIMRYRRVPRGWSFVIFLRTMSFGKGDCAGVRARATTAGWLNSFSSSPDSSPSTSRPRNQFLQTNVSGLNVGTTTTADGSGSPTVFYLNMSALGGM